VWDKKAFVPYALYVHLIHNHPTVFYVFVGICYNPQCSVLLWAPIMQILTCLFFFSFMVWALWHVLDQNYIFLFEVYESRTQGRTPRMSDQHIDWPVHTQDNTETQIQTSVPWAGFIPTIPVTKWPIRYALDHSHWDQWYVFSLLNTFKMIINNDLGGSCHGI
jgi:hypothetical protein